MSWTHAIFLLGMNVSPRSLRSARRGDAERKSNEEITGNKVISLENVIRLKRKKRLPAEEAQVIPFPKVVLK
jgi:hypothetical protein